MIITLPVSHVDLHLAKLLSAWMVKLGGMEKERVIVAVTRQASWDIEPVVETLKQGFGEVNCFTLPTEHEEGWPTSANHLFLSTVEHLALIRNDQPFYFFESDNVPLRPGWFAALEEEYYCAGKPYMGVINATKYQHVMTGEKIIRGKHMVGTGIYPADFFTRCRAVHYMDRRPFDICIENEVVPECHDTKLIAHRWGTVNYRAENGHIIMDDRKPGFDYAAPISEEAVIVHGVKDVSLYNLLDPAGLTS